MAIQGVFFMPHPPLAVPAIGGGNERKIQKTLDGYKAIAKTIKSLQPDRIILVTPHGNAFKEALVMLFEEHVSGDFAMFGYPELKVDKVIDLTMTQTLYKAFEACKLPAMLLDQSKATEYGIEVFLDHGALVPIHYIDRDYSDYKIVHITTSYASAKVHYKIGEVIAEVLEKSEDTTVIIASGDLSHALTEDGPYTYNPYGKVFDNLVREAIKGQDPSALLTLDESSIEAAAQCGLRSFCLGFGAMAHRHYKSKVFSYEGPFGVGYLIGELVPIE